MSNVLVTTVQDGGLNGQPDSQTKATDFTDWHHTHMDQNLDWVTVQSVIYTHIYTNLTSTGITKNHDLWQLNVYKMSPVESDQRCRSSSFLLSLSNCVFGGCTAVVLFQGDVPRGCPYLIFCPSLILNSNPLGASNISTRVEPRLNSPNMDPLWISTGELNLLSKYVPSWCLWWVLVSRSCKANQASHHTMQV